MHDLLLTTLPLSSWRSKGRASSFLPFFQSSKSSAVCQLRILRGQSPNKSCLRKSLFHSSLVAEQLQPCSHAVLRITSHSHAAQKGYEACSGSYNCPTAETVATQLLVIWNAQVGNNNVLLIPKAQPKYPPHTLSSLQKFRVKVTLLVASFCRVSTLPLPWRTRAGWTQFSQILF